MLYLNTRNHQQRFSPLECLQLPDLPESGLVIPLGSLDIRPAQMRKRTLSENMADVINGLFDTELSRWNLEFAIGRRPVKLKELGNRVYVAECWHNPSWQFERLARGIEKAIRQSDRVSAAPSEWLMTASRIAVLYGVLGELMKCGAVSPEEPVDVAVASYDLSGVMAAWYAKQWGMPIDTVFCGCNENAAPWNLLHKGELRNDGVAVDTATPKCDISVPRSLERLIYHRLGREEAKRFVAAWGLGEHYYLERPQTRILKEGIEVSVVSRQRLDAASSSLYKTDGYRPDPYTALCYSALLDCRSRTGSCRTTLILSEEAPIHQFG